MIKLPPRENWFQYILGISALFVAGVAAFFSIMGIGMLFSGAAISAMIMATSLEIGKIAATTFLYRYWEKATKLLRTYLTFAIVFLVIITSAGVFGWLSSAYQSSAMQYQITQQQVVALTEQKGMLQTQAEQAKQRIGSLTNIRNEQEKRMNEALSSPILSRNPTALRQVQEQNISLIKQTDADMGTETGRYNEFIKGTIEMDKKILETKITSSKTKDIITFKFVADELGWELNQTVKWFIILIIVVFDPLAVCLILAYNVAAFGDDKKKKVEAPIEIECVPTEEAPLKAQALTPAPNPLKGVDGTPFKKILLNEVPVQVEEPKTEAPKIVENIVTPVVVNVPVVAPVASSTQPTPVLNHGLRDSDFYHAPTR